MKSKTAIFSVIWLLSLTVAYIVGAKMTSSNQETAEASDTNETARPSYRAKVTSSSSGSRSSASGSRTSSSASSASQQDVVTIINQNDPIERVNNLLALINRLGPNDFAQVVSDFRAAGLTRERWSEYSMLLHAWGKADPLGALDYAEKNTDSRHARQTILASWAADNPDAALQWAESKYDGDEGNPWLIGVIQGIVSTDPQKASSIMNTMPYSRERGDALQTIIPYITRMGQEKSIEWLDTIEDERLRSGAIRRVADRLAREDPEATAAWITSIEAGEARERAIGEVADTWADQDVASAVAWTDTLSGADKVRAARELIGEYTRENAEQASQWVSSLAGTEGYDRIADGFIWNAARSNPELALAKVSTIQDTKYHNRYYERILSDWNRRDASSAEAWMQANNISEELRQRALRRRDDNRRGR